MRVSKVGLRGCMQDVLQVVHDINDLRCETDGVWVGKEFVSTQPALTIICLQISRHTSRSLSSIRNLKGISEPIGTCFAPLVTIDGST